MRNIDFREETAASLVGQGARNASPKWRHFGSDAGDSRGNRVDRGIFAARRDDS